MKIASKEGNNKTWEALSFCVRCDMNAWNSAYKQTGAGNDAKQFWITKWWFQPIWKILVKLEIFPK